jgi:hypothetical protein
VSLSAVGERERQGARDAARSAGRLPKRASGNGMILILAKLFKKG